MAKDSSKVMMPVGGIDKSSGMGSPRRNDQFNGSDTNLDHSIKGASAHQGKSTNGKKGRSN